jgi:6-phosphogluconolactonase
MAVIIEESESLLFRRAADLFVESAARAIEKKGVFALALSGGSTPKGLYSLLASDYADRIDWKNTHVFWSDERNVGPDDPESNFRMAYETLLSKVSMPEGNIHRIKGEMEPHEAAADYTYELKRFFNPVPGTFPQFDLILLGMGEDGHTASIFPQTDVVYNTTDMAVASFVHKLDSYRITLAPQVLRRANRVIFMVTGTGKAKAVKEVLEGNYQPNLYPAQILRTASGEVIWLVDKPAASLLT